VFGEVRLIGEADLPDVAEATGLFSGFLRAGQRWEQKAGENRDDRDYNQVFKGELAR
jgi:hypothetical protein